MMGIIFETLLVNVLFACGFIITYRGAFCVTLSDDIEISAGKKTLRKIHKKHNNFWKKFMFLHFKEHINRYHYILFLCFIVSYPIAMVFLNLLIIFDTQIFRVLFLSFCSISFFASMLSSFVRWGLYRGNIVRPRPPKRKKIRKKNS